MLCWTRLWALATAALGLYWDVGWHIDLGRDKALFTPPHTMIVIGLAGIIYSACIAVLFATLDDAPVRVRMLGVRIPYSAIAMAALGVGALVGFPLDALGHEAYGIGVTLWSPTHLMLVGGGGLGTIAVWLMLMEGRPDAPLYWGGPSPRCPWVPSWSAFPASRASSTSAFPSSRCFTCQY